MATTRNPLGAGINEHDQDERIVRRPGENAAHQQADSRQTPEASPEQTYVNRGEVSEERDTHVKSMDEDELEEFLRTEFLNQVLPVCPTIKGYHTCWLSTTNQYDTIPYRMRLGYTPVTSEEAPQFKSTTMKTGDYSGMIGVNEMLLFKIPDSAYQKIMKAFHHDRPNSEEDRLRANIALMEGDGKEKPMIAEMGDGTQELMKRTSSRAPQRWD